MSVGKCPRRVLVLFMGCMSQPKVDWAEGEKWSRHLDQFRNHKYSTLVEGLICTRALVQSLGMRMGRYQGPNPLDPSLIVFQILIPSKGFLIGYLNSHTHSSMHLNIQHVILSQNPNINLPWHSFKITRRQQRYHKAVVSTKHNQAYSITQAQHHGIKQNFQV